MKSYTKGIKNLVKERLMVIPANVRFSIGDFGDFTSSTIQSPEKMYENIGNYSIELNAVSEKTCNNC